MVRFHGTCLQDDRDARGERTKKRLEKALLSAYAKTRKDGERFGDFVIRTGVVKATTAGNRIYADLQLAVS